MSFAQADTSRLALPYTVAAGKDPKGVVNPLRLRSRDRRGNLPAINRNTFLWHALTAVPANSGGIQAIEGDFLGEARKKCNHLIA